MQHDHVLKKLNFDLLTPTPGVGVVCRQNICNHVAAFVILFNLICNMTMFWEKLNLTYWPHPKWVGGEGGGGGGATMLLHSWFSLIWYATWSCFEKVEFWPHLLSPCRRWDTDLWLKIMLDMFHIYCTSVCMRNFHKKYKQLTELLRNSIWGQWGGVNFLSLSCLSTGTG